MWAFGGLEPCHRVPQWCYEVFLYSPIYSLRKGTSWWRNIKNSCTQLGYITQAASLPCLHQCQWRHPVKNNTGKCRSKSNIFLTSKTCDRTHRAEDPLIMTQSISCHYWTCSFCGGTLQTGPRYVILTKICRNNFEVISPVLASNHWLPVQGRADLQGINSKVLCTTLFDPICIHLLLRCFHNCYNYFNTYYQNQNYFNVFKAHFVKCFYVKPGT